MLSLSLFIMYLSTSFANIPQIDRFGRSKYRYVDPFLENPQRGIFQQQNTSTSVFNIIDCGAKGDGITDSTIAIQSCVNFATSGSFGGVVYFPSGQYLIKSSIFIEKNASPLSFAGDGWLSILLWASESDLFVWKTSVDHASFHDFAVVSVATQKPVNSFAFRFSELTQSTFRQLLFYGAGSIPGNHVITNITGAVHLGNITDTVSLTDCVVWFGIGTLIRIGRGSEVRIQGGRLIGATKSFGIGVHVTGNNGGVHIVDTDVIGLKNGVVSEDATGAGSNREIFISQATIDSNYVGVSIWDSSYVDITGVWVASSDRDNIWVSPQSLGAVLALTGGLQFIFKLLFNFIIPFLMTAYLP